MVVDDTFVGRRRSVAGDGAVSAHARVVPVDVHGPPEQRFDLVVLADGFDAARVERFAELTARLRRELLATPPFGTLRQLWNLWRIDRAGPEDLGAQVDPDSARLLTVNAGRALALTLALGTQPDALLVVVDYPQYAGSGVSRVAVVSSHEDAPSLMLHELGHAAFGLADEYGGPGPAASGPGEPVRVNVTREPDPARVKWADLVSTNNTVGCFEGGDRTDLGIYRPSEACLMRSVGQQFCPVCRRQISRTLLACFSGVPLPEASIRR